MSVICVAEAVKNEYKIEEVPVRNMSGDRILPQYVHGWKITAGEEAWIIVINHKEEDNPRRQIYLVEDLSVYARTTVFYRKKGSVERHILEY